MHHRTISFVFCRMFQEWAWCYLSTASETFYIFWIALGLLSRNISCSNWFMISFISCNPTLQCWKVVSFKTVETGRDRPSENYSWKYTVTVKLREIVQENRYGLLRCTNFCLQSNTERSTNVLHKGRKQTHFSLWTELIFEIVTNQTLEKTKTWHSYFIGVSVY